MSELFPITDDNYVLIGKIAKPHGLRGEVKVQSFSDEPESVLNYMQVVLVDEKGVLSPSLQIEKARLQGKNAVLKLATIDDRDRAEQIHGLGILVLKEDLPEVEEGEYYWYQYIDLPVHTEDGSLLGKVASIFSNGAQDILVIRNNNKEYLIPVINEVIVSQTKEGLVIAPPPGLLDMNIRIDE